MVLSLDDLHTLLVGEVTDGNGFKDINRYHDCRSTDCISNGNFSGNGSNGGNGSFNAARKNINNDIETLLRALATAGSAGLAWREGTPADWPDERLLDAGEVLYSAGRMIHRNGRRYLRWPSAAANQGTPDQTSNHE